jgi:hypothetical protein
MTVERKVTFRHGVDSRPKRSSRGYPADRTALRAVIEIIALPADFQLPDYETYRVTVTPMGARFAERFIEGRM